MPIFFPFRSLEKKEQVPACINQEKNEYEINEWLSLEQLALIISVPISNVIAPLNQADILD